MSDFYDDLAETAGEMLAEFGRDVILRRPNTGTYNAASDSHVGGSAPIERTVTVVFTTFKAHELIDEMVKRTDTKILMASSAEPRKDDIIIDGGEQYRVIAVEVIKPGPTAVLYKVQARK